MIKVLGVLLMAGIAAAEGSQGWAQTAAGSLIAGKEAGEDHAAGQSAAAPDARTEKQKLLATQTERLFTMATELKAQVDRTNKNILSLKVVQKAEEIESLAKGMRGVAKK